MSEKMREILFRGKTKHGKWVYGCFCGKTLNHMMDGTEECIQVIHSETLYWHEVEPKTVGQFTGLTDKNGTKIFEGDILAFWSDIKKSFCENYETVVYGVENCGCCYSVYGWSSKNRYGCGDCIGSPESCVVVGNIHDNPELLEEATNV